VGKVLAIHNAHPKTVPLIKCSKFMWFFKIFTSPKIIINEFTKETKIFFFLVFWVRRGLILAPTYLHENGESGYVVLGG